MNEAFIQLLQCPKTGQSLRLEGEQLITEDGQIAYPLVDGIPQLLEEDGVVLHA
jgi:uncharacterized protein YbaR (Trm112 family)